MEGRWTADWWTLASPERPLGLGLALLEYAVFPTGSVPMKHPQKFYQPLAIGAPSPLRELPVQLERMIHFVPPHIEKLRAKVPDLIREVDVVLGNLEDAIEIVATVGDKLDVVMLPKVEGAWDIHYLDQLLAQLEARHAVKKPIL